MLKYMIVLCAVLGVAFASQAIGKPEPKPDKFKDVEGCYIEEFDAVIPLGESRPSTKSCMRYSCGSEWVTYDGCGVVGAHPPCKVVKDTTKPYPGCCGKVECP